MKLVRMDDSYLSENVKHNIPSTQGLEIRRAHKWIHQGGGEGSEFLGWVQLPVLLQEDEVDEILYTAEVLQNETDVMIVIGIGGSYLGARAAIQMLTPTFQNRIYFAGHQMSATYLKDLVEELGEVDFCINVISKSGTTLESALSFRFFRELLMEQCGDEATNRIIVTTDAKKGALYELAQREGYKTFVIPDNIGGRYSVLTPVGLLPMAYAGIDIEDVLEGASLAFEDCRHVDLQKNDAYRYAVIRNLLMAEDKHIEVMVQYEPKLYYFTEWWKQLFGESEGKDGKGLFPANLSFSTDLHSMGQYLQQGPRHMFETVLWVDEPDVDWSITGLGDETDGLSYLEGKGLNYVNKIAMEASTQAHSEGGVPTLLFHFSRLDAHTFGYAVYFFMMACAMSAYLLGVNPFNQPGVETYKRNMYRLLTSDEEQN